MDVRTNADDIVAAVQAHPKHADVLVSPAVRVLVTEVLRLRAELARVSVEHPGVPRRDEVLAALKQADDDMAALEAGNAI